MNLKTPSSAHAAALLAAAMLLAGCAGPASQPVSTVPGMFDRAPTAADRARFESIRANIARQLVGGMNFRIAGTANNVLVAHGVPSRIVVGPGNFIRIALVKSSRPQFALSVVDNSLTRHPEFDPVEGSGDGGGSGSSRQLSCGTWEFLSRGRGRLITFIPGTTVDGSWISDDGSGTCGVGP